MNIFPPAFNFYRRLLIDKLQIREAFAYCERLTRNHYENFPVASLMLPAHLRPFVAALYAYARTADDFADELPASPEERMQRLDDWERELKRCMKGDATHPVFIALADTFSKTDISPELLSDLLTAYRMDVVRSRFERFTDLLHYCRFSANPVGRLVLQLFQEDDEENRILSDSICSGLQLANFWQDLSLDWPRGRLYLPLEDLARFGYTEKDLSGNNVDERFRSMMAFEVDRTEGFLRKGAPLLDRLKSRRLRFELSLTVRGGLAILRKIRGARYDVLRGRPVLAGTDKFSILFSAAVGRTI